MRTKGGRGSRFSATGRADLTFGQAIPVVLPLGRLRRRGRRLDVCRFRRCADWAEVALAADGLLAAGATEDRGLCLAAVLAFVNIVWDLVSAFGTEGLFF